VFSHLGGLKLLPRIPRALPILFFSPTLRLQEMKIGRGGGPFAKMTSSEKRVIYLTVLHLRAIQFVTNAGVVGGVVDALLQVLKGKSSGDWRKGDRFAVSLGQLVCGVKIFLSRFVFRYTSPSIAKPVGMLLNNLGNFLGFAAFGP